MQNNDGEIQDTSKPKQSGKWRVIIQGNNGQILCPIVFLYAFLAKSRTFSTWRGRAMKGKDSRPSRLFVTPRIFHRTFYVTETSRPSRKVSCDISQILILARWTPIFPLSSRSSRLCDALYCLPCIQFSSPIPTLSDPIHPVQCFWNCSREGGA